MRLRRWLIACLVPGGVIVWGVWCGGCDEIVIGGQCDRTGPNQACGHPALPWRPCYVKLVNKQGGVKGTCCGYIEVEHGY